MRLLKSIKLILSLRCNEATQLASDALDRKLTWDERIALRLHTLVCVACRRCMRQLRAMHESFRKLPEQWRQDASLPHDIRLSAERQRQIKQLLADAGRLDSK